MDPMSAKVAGGGLSGVGGELSKAGDLGKTGSGAKFEAIRTEQAGDPATRAEDRLNSYLKTGKLDAAQQPSMADRIAARDGISFQPNLQFAQGPDATGWAAQSVSPVDGSHQVAGAVQGLNQSQVRLEEIIGDLRSGKQYSQSELIGLQAEVNVLSEQVQMSTKLVDSAMQSIKSVMQQQV